MEAASTGPRTSTASPGKARGLDRCFCTNGICAPSRATILTGKYSHLNGVRDNSRAFDGSQETFPKLLQKAGYETALIGKWHLQSDPTGFDQWNILPGQGDYYNPDLIETGVRTRRPGYVTDILTDLAVDFHRGAPGFVTAFPSDAPSQGPAPELAAGLAAHGAL